MLTWQVLPMPILAILLPLIIGYFFERSQRTNLLIVFQLADQLKYKGSTAKAAERQ